MAIMGGADMADGNGVYDQDVSERGFDARGEQLRTRAQQGDLADTPLPLEPPMEVLTAQACVVYGLSPA